ncbi:DUF4271 domain-containing protein [Polaribacter sp. MSW13]|uniref:DUF4271 domain-containing protein n=1 Tax=Polaribacter marinus TaxID=2916838 RepID=A0A9X1VNK0_9FLAO|nr:DUF4271 domain-containing protein [Polaribacter marinus]MCI2229386.1 DUF4271 domain-containing protein [Polaribacter marinus]
MQGIERIENFNNGITIVLMALFTIVFLLKGLNADKLKGFAFSFFNKAFVEKEVEENMSFFKTFYGIIFIFSVAVLALVVTNFLQYQDPTNPQEIIQYWAILLILFLYFLIKWVLENVLAALFLIKEEVRFFLISKSTYFYTVSLMLFIAYVLFEYTGLKPTYLYYFTCFLFVLRFLIQIVNNKKLIFSKLFYFILYLCAFEIAPLFILFKLML